MDKTTTSGLSAEMKALYQRTLLERLLATYLHCQFADEGKTAVLNGRKTVEWRRWEALAAATTPLTEGTVGSSNTQVVTAVTATPLQYGDFITHSDLLEVTSFDPYIDSQAAVFGDQAGDTLDQVCRDILHAGSNVLYAGGAVSRVTVAAGNLIDMDLVLLAVKVLENGKVPRIPDEFGGSYIAFVSAQTALDIRKDPAWIRVNEYAGGTKVFSGELGRYGGVRLILNTNAKVFAGAGASGIDVHSTLVFGAHWYGKAKFGDVKDTGVNGNAANGEMVKLYVKLPGSAGSADPIDQIGSMGWKVSHVTKILNDLCGLRIEHATST